MSLISSAPFSSVTTYRKDYAKKICPRSLKWKPVPELENPITGPLEEHVLPKMKYEQLSQPQTRYPDPKEYAEHVANSYPSTRIFLKDPPGGPPDLEVIDKLYEDDNRTNYMISYCERGDYEAVAKSHTRNQPLPENWDIPCTTQKKSFRPPRLMAPEGLAHIEMVRPTDNLTPNPKVREILNIKTGESIYISDISNTGMEIIKGKFHGDVSIRPQFNQDDLLKAMLIRRE